MITDLNPNRGKNPNETYGKRGKRTYDVHTAAALAENSVKSNGAQTIHNVRPQRKQLKIGDYIAIGLTGLGAIAILGVTFKDVIIRKIELNKANRYMHEEMIDVLEENACGLIATPKSIGITSTEKEILDGVAQSLEDRGFTEDEMYYAIYATCGEDDLAKMVCNGGYDGIRGYMEDKHFIQDYQVSYNMFENNVEVGYVENVNKLKNEKLENENTLSTEESGRAL